MGGWQGHLCSPLKVTFSEFDDPTMKVNAFTWNEVRKMGASKQATASSVANNGAPASALAPLAAEVPLPDLLSQIARGATEAAAKVEALMAELAQEKTKRVEELALQKQESKLAALQKATLAEAKLAEAKLAAQSSRSTLLTAYNSELKSHKAEIAKVQIQQLPRFTQYSRTRTEPLDPQGHVFGYLRDNFIRTRTRHRGPRSGDPHRTAPDFEVCFTRPLQVGGGQGQIKISKKS